MVFEKACYLETLIRSRFFSTIYFDPRDRLDIRADCFDPNIHRRVSIVLFRSDGKNKMSRLTLNWFNDAFRITDPSSDCLKNKVTLKIITQFITNECQKLEITQSTPATSGDDAETHRAG